MSGFEEEPLTYEDELADNCSRLTQENAALTAERDELKRRLAAVLEMLRPKSDRPYSWNALDNSEAKWAVRNALYESAAAIAEGSKP